MLSAAAQTLLPEASADVPYTLVVDIQSPTGGALLHRTFKCASFLITCEGDASFETEGKLAKARIHARAYDGRHLAMQIEGPLGEEAFDRLGFHDGPAKTGQEWEGELTRQHLNDFDPKWSAAQLAAAHRQPPTLVARVRIRIDG
jgi:hypothetical protein